MKNHGDLRRFIEDIFHELAAQTGVKIVEGHLVKRARSRLPEGESQTHCEACGATIPVGRRKAIPGVKLCISCQTEHDQE